MHHTEKGVPESSITDVLTKRGDVDTAHGKDKAHDPEAEGRGQGDASHKRPNADPGKQRHEARRGDIQHSIWTWARLGGGSAFRCFVLPAEFPGPCRSLQGTPCPAHLRVRAVTARLAQSPLQMLRTSSGRSRCFPGPLRHRGPSQTASSHHGWPLFNHSLCPSFASHIRKRPKALKWNRTRLRQLYRYRPTIQHFGPLVQPSTLEDSEASSQLSDEGTAVPRKEKVTC